MHKLISRLLLVAASAALVPAWSQDHPSVKHAVNPAPSAELAYAIKARQHGFALGGDALITWHVQDGKYSLVEETRATLLGKILEHRSEGAIDAYGIAPASFYEKRFRKDPSTTSFNRETHSISFTEGKLSYPIKGGEQDRSTAAWQLLAVARAAPEKFVAGSEWSFFVAGRHDAERWTFKVVGQENVRTGAGDFNCVHLVKAPPPDSKDQQVDLWLAPGLDWYPVRLRFSDDEDDFVDQTLSTITRK